MHPFQVGDIVVCIDDKPAPDHQPPKGCQWIKAGRVYRVKAILQVVGLHGPRFGIELVDVPGPLPHSGWHAWRFRKIERADDNFIATLRAARANTLFASAVRAAVAAHYRRWSASGGYKQARARHVARLLVSYGTWFQGVFGCYPDACHVRSIADSLFVWRSVPTAETKGMNPWIVPADFPALCRVALSDCATNKGVGHA